MSLTRASYHQRSLYLTPTGQNRAVKRLYIRHLAGKRTVSKGGCLRGPVGAYRGGELALGWCWPRRSARLWSGGAQLCLGAGEAERGFAPTSAAPEPCLPGLALLAFGRALERGLFLWQPSRAFEGVSSRSIPPDRWRCASTSTSARLRGRAEPPSSFMRLSARMFASGDGVIGVEEGLVHIACNKAVHASTPCPWPRAPRRAWPRRPR